MQNALGKWELQTVSGETREEKGSAKLRAAGTDEATPLKKSDANRIHPTVGRTGGGLL
jgi:hypothetical protein